MGIYITGMEMPEFGEKIIVLTSSGYVENVSGQVIEGVEAVPVPSHGRLIDADALEEDGADIHEDVVYCGYVEDSIWGFSHEMIENAPTIIPAEEGE